MGFDYLLRSSLANHRSGTSFSLEHGTQMFILYRQIFSPYTEFYLPLSEHPLQWELLSYSQKILTSWLRLEPFFLCPASILWQGPIWQVHQGSYFWLIIWLLFTGGWELHASFQSALTGLWQLQYTGRRRLRNWCCISWDTLLSVSFWV